MGASGTKYASADLLAKDMTGKVIVVTGGNSGIGKSTCLQLTKQGASVIVCCRRIASGEEVALECNNQPDKLFAGNATAMVLDIASLASVKTFATAFTKQHKSLDVLCNNAGIMNTAKGKTSDGFELQFGTNHCGHFALTGALMGALVKAPSPRVVCLSSCFHNDAMGKKGRIDFEDPNFETRPYDGWTSYAQSKLANLLFAKEMSKKFPKIMSVSVHPGFVESNLMKMPAVALFLMTPALRYGMGQIDPWAGVQTSLHACLSDELENGRYYAQVGTPKGIVGGWPCEPKDMNEEVTEENAAKLWALSEKLTGVKY